MHNWPPWAEGNLDHHAGCLLSACADDLLGGPQVGWFKSAAISPPQCVDACGIGGVSFACPSTTLSELRMGMCGALGAAFLNGAISPLGHSPKENPVMCRLSLVFRFFL